MLLVRPEEDCDSLLSNLTLLAVSHQFPLAWNWSSDMADNIVLVGGFTSPWSSHKHEKYFDEIKDAVSVILCYFGGCNVIMCAVLGEGVRLIEMNEWKKGSKLWSIYIGEWREKNGFGEGNGNREEYGWRSLTIQGWLDSAIKLKVILK